MSMRLIDKDALLAEYDRVHIGEPGRARKLIEDAPEVFPYTDDEVQKMQDMQSAEVEKAFELGREDVEQQWIPCSERLPEDLEEVNVTWVNHDPEPYYDFTKDKPATASAVYYKEKWYWYSSVCTDLLAEYGENEVDKMDDAIEVLAWMPLPEPWRGEEHETCGCGCADR